MMLAEFALALTLLTPGQQQPDKGTVQNSLSWLKSTWTRVQKEGAPAAERVIRQFPAQFKAVPKRVGDLVTTVDANWSSMRVEERKQLMVELWKIRHSVDLMSMLSPDVLEQLIGVDKKTLARLQTQLQSAQKAVGMTVKKSG